MEKKKSFFERRPYVCYALYACLLYTSDAADEL